MYPLIPQLDTLQDLVNRAAGIIDDDDDDDYGDNYDDVHGNNNIVYNAKQQEVKRNNNNSKNNSSSGDEGNISSGKMDIKRAMQQVIQCVKNIFNFYCF